MFHADAQFANAILAFAAKNALLSHADAAQFATVLFAFAAHSAKLSHADAVLLATDSLAAADLSAASPFAANQFAALLAYITIIAKIKLTKV